MSKRPIEPLPLKSSKNSRPAMGVVGRVVTRVVVVVVAGRAVVVVLRCVVVARCVVVVLRCVVVRRVVVVAWRVVGVLGVVPRLVVDVALVVDVVAGARPAALVEGATRMVAGVRPRVVAVDPVAGASEPGVDCWEAPAGAVSELVAVLPAVEPAVESLPDAAVVSADGSVVSTDDGEPSPWTTTTGSADATPSPPSAETVDSTASIVPSSEFTVPA